MPGIDQYTKLLLHMDGDTSSTIGGNDSYTKLLLHLDTSPFVDDSHDDYTVTNNNVTRNTSIKKFGGGSGYFNGSNAYLSVADSSSWDFGSSDFTIDFWVRLASNTTRACFIHQWTGGDKAWFLDYYDDSTQQMQIRSTTDGSTTVSYTHLTLPTKRIV